MAARLVAIVALAILAAWCILLAMVPTAAQGASWEPSREVASCYGPGLYGNATANGTTLRVSTEGIAHRSLPLGTPVIVNIGRRATFARVIDRGPFVPGRTIDVTAATARRLGYPTCRAFGVRGVNLWRINS